MKMRLILLFFSILIYSSGLYADSPITSTEISTAYQEDPIVIAATNAKGVLNKKILQYLSNEKNPVDVKMAIINALSWDIDGKQNAKLFMDYLVRKKMIPSKDKFIETDRWDLLICMAYLKAMDNYFDVGEAVEMANRAKEKNSKSYTVNIICAIIEAQKIMDYDWCRVYNLSNNVRLAQSLDMDMKADAVENIFEYMDLYKGSCE